MEMGSSSSTESLNGLKFGHKIYFEDSTSSAAPGAARPGGSTVAKKVRSGPVQACQPPRCQVEGCKVDLSDAKAYYSRHKVCGMHSKSPKVIVAGLEQRFCQQCSRFHQLLEFDQGKRSCRRRLAGHNERRRKPPTGSLLSTRYEPGSRVGSFLMDFSAYPRIGRDAWPGGRIPGSQGGIATGKYLPYPWQSNSYENPPPPDLFLQTSACGTSITAGHGIPPPAAAGECISAVGDSKSALSLLSNEPWGSRSRSPSGFELYSLMNNNAHGAPVAEPTTSAPLVNHFPSTSWGVKGDSMAGSSSHQILSDLGLGQISQPLSGKFSGELELSQQSRRPYMEPANPRDFDDSDQHMHWSL